MPIAVKTIIFAPSRERRTAVRLYGITDPEVGGTN